MATFTNTATLSYNGTTTVSNTTTGEILDQLTLSKTAVRPVYSQSDDTTYVINLINTGTTDLAEITLTDNLGLYTYGALNLTPLDYTDDSVKYFVNGVQQAAPTAVITDNNLVLSGITIPAGGNASIVYEASANGFASPEAGAAITNTVTASGAALGETVSASETVTSSPETSLNVTKSLNPSVVSANGRVTYTFVIQNSGNTAVTADGDSILSDVFTPALSDITVSFNNSPWTANTNYTYNEATGEFATVAGQLTVPAATFTRDTATGVWNITPGTSELVISGTI